MAQMVKRLPPMQETWIQSLGWEDILEKEMPTPVFLPGKSHGWRRLVGYRPWGRKESDTIEGLNFHFDCTMAIFQLVMFYYSFAVCYKWEKLGKMYVRSLCVIFQNCMLIPGGSDCKESACNVGDLGLIPGLGDLLEKGMATHSSIPAWRNPWTEKPGRLQSRVAKYQTQLSN